MSDQEQLLAQLEAAQSFLYQYLPPSPQIFWPLLGRRLGREIWVKHDNHLPCGSYRLRGALTYLAQLREENPYARIIVAPAIGSHGHAAALAAACFGMQAIIVADMEISSEKAAAIRGFGAELIVAGNDVEEAEQEAVAIAKERNGFFMPLYHSWMIGGASIWALELLRAVPDIQTLYVPLGYGVAASGAIAARDALGLETKIVGVVPEGSPAFADSVWARKLVTTSSAFTLADGMECCKPDEQALQIAVQGLERIVRVSDQQILEAIALYYKDCRNIADPQGAASLAGLFEDEIDGGKSAVLLSGSNIETPVFLKALGVKDGLF